MGLFWVFYKFAYHGAGAYQLYLGRWTQAATEGKSVDSYDEPERHKDDLS
jgi:hypothetical protein